MNNIYCTYICWYSFITLIVLFDSICWVEITFCQSKGKSSAGVAGKKIVGHSRSPPNGSSRVNFRVFPDPRVFSNRGTTFISSISTLWSRAILSFFFGFEVNLKGSSCVQLVAAVSSPGMPSLNKTLRKKLVIFDTLQRNLLDTQLEGPEGWKSWIFKEKDKIQPFWFLILWKVRMKATIRIKDRFGIYFWAHILFQSSQANLSQPESSDVLVGKKKTTRGFTIS